jgi:hypothetical protein
MSRYFELHDLDGDGDQKPFTTADEVRATLNHEEGQSYAVLVVNEMKQGALAWDDPNAFQVVEEKRRRHSWSGDAVVALMTAVTPIRSD